MSDEHVKQCCESPFQFCIDTNVVIYDHVICNMCKESK